jgi:large subunit ribosomal protein L11
MTKEIKARIKFKLPAGAATPAPPVGSMLGQLKVNIPEFCKQFNARTADKKGQTLPVKVLVYTDNTFTFEVKTPSVTDLIKKRSNVQKGAARPHEQKIGRLSHADVQEIAKIKMVDLNAHDLDAACRIIVGSARSMGIEVVD